MERIIVAIGGGELKNKTTLAIDAYVAALVKKRAGQRRANMLFLGTASHDSMPYFNSFRKTYTSVFDIKAEVGLLVYGEMDGDKVNAKLAAADGIYVGGGDTLYMLETWRQRGIISGLLAAYRRGAVLCGLSAGAICWFERMYIGADILSENAGRYVVADGGLGIVKGLVCPHYDSRPSFDAVALEGSYAIGDNCALVFADERYKECVGAGGSAYYFSAAGKVRL